jgi:hypothetical protein
MCAEWFPRSSQRRPKCSQGASNGFYTNLSLSPEPSDVIVPVTILVLRSLKFPILELVLRTREPAAGGAALNEVQVCMNVCMYVCRYLPLAILAQAQVRVNLSQQSYEDSMASCLRGDEASAFLYATACWRHTSIKISSFSKATKSISSYQSRGKYQCEQRQMPASVVSRDPLTDMALYELHGGRCA